MVAIVDEIVQYAAARGYTFSPTSLSALQHDFPKIEELSRLTKPEREALYDLILDQVSIQLGSPPQVLHEDSIPNAAQALSQRFQTGVGLQQFAESAQNVIKDCCPYC